MNSARSPFDIEIVFKIIMNHLGSDHQSLLACRLVSHTWNRMALEILKDNGASITVFKDLNGEMGIKCEAGLDTYLHYRRLVESHEKTVISALDNLNITLNVGSREPVLIPLSIFRKVEDDTPNLMITSMKFEGTDSHQPRSLENQTDLLRSLVLSCAPTLKSLTFSDLLGVGRIDWNLEFGPGQFPHLESIHILLDPQIMLSNHVATTTANSSPNLRIIRIEHPPNMESVFPNFLQIHTLLSRLLLRSPQTMLRIEELEFSLPHWNTFPQDFFTGIHLPALKKLVLHLQIELLQIAENQDQIQNLLSERMPCLESLELRWVTKSMASSSPDTFLPTFPLLPKLTHFGMSGMTNLWSISSASASENNRFMGRLLGSIAVQCLNINSFSIDHRSLCQMIPWYTGIVFPAADTLDLSGFAPKKSIQFQFCHNSRPFVPQLEKDDAAHTISDLVAAMFPNLRRISIDFGPHISDSSLEVFEQRLLTGLMNVDGITTLEFKNYYRNWLGESGNGNFALGSELECLRLQLPRHLRNGNKFELIKPADVEKLISTLPSLKVLEMNPSLLITNGGTNKFNEILEEMQEVRNKFPNIDIHIITN